MNKIREGIGDKIANFLQWTSACICGFILGLVYGWKLALVIVALSPVLILCAVLMSWVRKFVCLSFNMLLDVLLAYHDLLWILCVTFVFVSFRVFCE